MTDVLVLDRVGFRQFVVDRLLLPVDDAEAFVEFAQPLVVVGVLRLELFDGAFLPQREDEDSREQQNRARHDGEEKGEGQGRPARLRKAGIDEVSKHTQGDEKRKNSTDM